MEEAIVRPANVTDEHLEYLDELRGSGDTNMYGAAPYLSEAFGISRNEAREILTYWMKSYGKENR